MFTKKYSFFQLNFWLQTSLTAGLIFLVAYLVSYSFFTNHYIEDLAQVAEVEKIAKGTVAGVMTTQCDDGVDNDNDGLVDWQYDLGCYNSQDNSEGGVYRPTLPV